MPLLAIQSVESIPHELPFFQKRYDYFENGLVCVLLNGLLCVLLNGLLNSLRYGFFQLTLRTYRELLELVSRGQ